MILLIKSDYFPALDYPVGLVVKTMSIYSQEGIYNGCLDGIVGLKRLFFLFIYSLPAIG